MNFTKEQKLLAIMLAEIHEKLEIKNGIDADLVMDAIRTDNEWALDWKYGGNLWVGDETPAHVRHVSDVLDMWLFIDQAYDRLGPDDLEKFAKAYSFGKPKFKGFDGNHESEYMDAARVMVAKLGRYQSYVGRESLNSHMPTVATSERMLEVFEPIRAQLGDRLMDVDDLIAVFTARVHPANRD